MCSSSHEVSYTWWKTQASVSGMSLNEFASGHVQTKKLKVSKNKIKNKKVRVLDVTRCMGVEKQSQGFQRSIVID